MASKELNLAPPLVGEGKSNELQELGQALFTSWSPLNDSLGISVTSTKLGESPSKASSGEETDVYFAQYEQVPSSERRLFITDTVIIFAAFQNLLKASQPQGPDWLQSEQTLTTIRKLGIDYVNFIKECWIHASQPLQRPDEELQYSSDHYRSLYTCFSLFVVLHLPEPGFEDAPVGDELMEWLNTHFIEPSTEEGETLSSLEKPWEDESFWPYLTRSTIRGLQKSTLFFLNVLSKHPSEDLQDLTDVLTPLIETQPRLQNFHAERDFAIAYRRWHDKVKTLRVQMERVPEDLRFDDYENWWDRLSDIIGILEGRADVLKRVCSELGADWKEICVAWGIFIDPRLRRQDLADVVADAVDELPPDPTNLEDLIHVATFLGSFEEVLEHGYKLDPWISAHLADMMTPLALIDPENDPDSELSLRDSYVLNYAEYLHSDPALWRISVDYMYSCGEIGKRRADQILLRVPLRLHEQVSSNRAGGGGVVGVLKDVNQTCLQYEREPVRRTICRIASQELIGHKEYGLAVAYCISAEDWPGLGRIVDSVLNEYTQNGAAVFAQHASRIAPSIQELQTRSTLHGIFVHRLLFAVRYGHFHQLCLQGDYPDAASDLVSMFGDDLVPTSWFAVLLCDSVKLLQHNSELLFTSGGAGELLRKLNEVFTGSTQGAAGDYLPLLIRSLKLGSEKEALDRLQLVRLALAKYFARCTTLPY